MKLVVMLGGLLALWVGCADRSDAGDARSSPDAAQGQGGGRPEGGTDTLGTDSADASGAPPADASAVRDAAAPQRSCVSAGSLDKPYGVARPGQPCDEEGYRRCWDNTPHVCAAGADGPLVWQPEPECAGERPACMGGCCQAGVVQVVAGGTHTCALRSTGQVKCWGRGTLGSGQMGVSWGDNPGEMGDVLPAVDLGSGQKATRIAGGFATACAVLEGGQLKCWGKFSSTMIIGDEPGEMGDNLPAFDFGVLAGVRSIDVNGAVCAVLDTGEVRCWKPWEQADFFDARRAQVVDLGLGRRAVAVNSAWQNCAVFDDGALKCWGINFWGQLGLGDTEDRDDPTEMGDALPEVALGAGRHVVDVSVAGGAGTCVVLSDGSASCWGLDGSAPLPGAPAGGPQFYLPNELGVKPDGWRGDEPDEMGDSLALLELEGRATRVAEQGGLTWCVVLEDGRIQCWGFGFITPGDRPGPPIEIGHGRRIVDLAVETAHACAILDTGQLKCWGIGDGTEVLGLGDRWIDRPEPTDDLPEVDLGEG